MTGVRSQRPADAPYGVLPPTPFMKLGARGFRDLSPSIAIKRNVLAVDVTVSLAPSQ
jgi:hypothetical protein